MKSFQLIAATAAGTALLISGWGEYWLTDLSLIFAGAFIGHVLTEVLNDPSE